MAPGESILASDAERSAAVERLQRAHMEGRLTDEEVADRIGSALQARTRGELAVLLADLPTTDAGPANTPSGAVPVPQPVVPAVSEPSPMRAAWTAWAIASAVTFVVWGIVAVTAGATYPWFLWVAGPWGAVLLVKTLLGERGGDA